MTSSRDASPDITSRSPDFAVGAKVRVSLGARKSQSTNITCLSAFAISCASEAEIVDLPSPGEVEVIPMIFFGLRAFFGTLTLRRSIASFIERTDSVYG